MSKRKGWNAKLEPPVPLPGGGSLKTVSDADNYVGRLTKRDQQRPEWKTAADYLVKAAADPAWAFFARRAVYIALHGDDQTPLAIKPSKDEAYRARRQAWKAAQTKATP